MKILLLYPEYPDTFWSLKYALKFTNKKSAHPPLGLLTIASLLPSEWEKKLVDMNVQKLNEKDIEWADYVFISAMNVQIDSVKEIINICKKKNKRIVAGGPLFSIEPEKFDEIDYLVLDEGEITLPRFLKDLNKNKAKHIYRAEEFTNMENVPLPSWNLINLKKYFSMCIQYSRGCPYDCEFCNITLLFGRKPRVKSAEQIIQELEMLYKNKWRGPVFFVDDNFIGNKKHLKEKILPEIIKWMEKKKYPFTFFTEASINLADDEELIKMLVEAGFDKVFVGIETPSEESLKECNKFINIGRNLVRDIEKIQKNGLQVQGGFIVGFDSDKPSIFKRQLEFIQKSKIVVAMVGLLNAPPGTRLFKKLKQENRILERFLGNNTDFITNIIPRMGYERLVREYRNLVNKIYSPKVYYERLLGFIREYKPGKRKARVRWDYIKAFIKSLYILGIRESGRRYYWKTLFYTFFRKPLAFPLVVGLAIYGYHFRKIFAR